MSLFFILLKVITNEYNWEGKASPKLIHYIGLSCAKISPCHAHNIFAFDNPKFLAKSILFFIIYCKNSLFIKKFHILGV